MELLPDYVDLCIVSDGLQRDVRHAFINKTLAEVAAGGSSRWNRVRNFGFLLLAFLAVGKQVISVTCTHDSSASESKRNPRGVDCDPAAPPLFCCKSSGAGTAGRIEN